MSGTPFSHKEYYYDGTELEDSEWLRRFVIKHNHHPANRVPSWELPRLRLIIKKLEYLDNSGINFDFSESEMSDAKTTGAEAEAEAERVMSLERKRIGLSNDDDDDDDFWVPSCNRCDDSDDVSDPGGSHYWCSYCEHDINDDGDCVTDPCSKCDESNDDTDDDDVEFAAEDYDFGKMITKPKELKSNFFTELDLLFGNGIEEYFDWPSTAIEPSWHGLSNLDSSEWPTIGVLKRMGYAVGSKDGISDHGRRCELLDYIFLSSKLPFVHSYEHMLEWGAASSSARLKKIANSMATFGRRMRRNEYFMALERYDQDLAYLKDKYYDPGFSGGSWGWPNTDDEY